MTQEERMKHFTPHTLVTWDKTGGGEHLNAIKKFVEQAGDGPFLVTATEDVLPENQEIVGHHQFVKCDINGVLKTLSGAVLIRY